jgi:hypothetical protein
MKKRVRQAKSKPWEVQNWVRWNTHTHTHTHTHIHRKQNKTKNPNKSNKKITKNEKRKIHDKTKTQISAKVLKESEKMNKSIMWKLKDYF